MIRMATVATAVALLSSVALAQTRPAPSPPSPNGDEAAELAQLMAILDEETEIATKTRLNSDFVPGIVTVLQGDELEALGVQTVWDALRQVPGIQVTLDAAGSPSVVVRGVDFPFNSGNVKVMIDSVPVSRESAGINGSALLMPIEMVDRIEVIRGPGSVVYGDFAFMGLVNIVTRSQDSRVHVQGESHGRWSGSARIGAREDAAVQWSVGVSAFTTDRARVRRGAVAGEERRFFVSQLHTGGLSLSAQFVQRNLDDHSPPGRAPIPLTYDQTSWAVQAAYEAELASDLRATLRVGHLNDDLADVASTFEDGVTRGGVDLHWQRWHRHALLFSAEYEALTIANAVHSPPDFAPPPQPGGPPSGGPSPGGSPTVRAAISDQDRDVGSVTLQDRFDATDALSFTAGLRWDDYSDVGRRWTPRVAVVWRASDWHIVKAQYAQGFRAPTFFELYGGGERNPDLGFEHNSTYEVNYVFKKPGMTGRVTLFRSEIPDMIFGDSGTPLFSNSREGRSHGVELEWTQEVASWLKVSAHGSWYDAEDDRGRDFTLHGGYAVPDWSGNVSAWFRPERRTVLGWCWNHLGDRPTEGAVSYDLVDVTVSRSFPAGLVARMGVTNLLNDPVRYVLSGVASRVTLDYGDRTVWAEVSWRR